VSGVRVGVERQKQNGGGINSLGKWVLRGRLTSRGEGVAKRQGGGDSCMLVEEKGKGGGRKYDRFHGVLRSLKMIGGEE